MWLWVRDRGGEKGREVGVEGEMLVVEEEEVDLRMGQRQAVPKPVLIGDEGVVVPWEISPTLWR